MIVLAEPVPSDMVKAIGKAIHILPNIQPQEMHLCVSSHLILATYISIIKCSGIDLLYLFFYCQMKSLYSWHDVARRTEVVYDCALRCSNENLLQRLPRYSFFFLGFPLPF